MAGGAEPTLSAAPPPESPWGTMRALARVRTIRRMWMAAPFLGIALVGIPSMLSLVYEDVYGLTTA